MGYGRGAASPLRWSWAVSQLVRRDLKVRYKNSVLGFCWSFLNPLMQIVVMTIVFKYIMGSRINNFSMELFTCFLPWLFFAQSLNDGAVCVAKDNLLVRKYAFPRIILPIASITSNLVHLFFGFLVLFAIFLVLPVHFNRHFLWVIPLLAIQFIFTLGLVLLVGTLQMYYEDIRFLLNSVVQLLFFLCPTVYTVEQVMESTRLSPLWKELYILLNPLTPLFIGYRTALLHGAEWPVPGYYSYLAVSALWALLFLGVGLLVWRRYEWHFAEVC
ncbi:MAG TPA: ABC transporter permease [Armatimonadota bacterium]|nr:ABC transporter permease [Armatimonadota bacterium]